MRRRRTDPPAPADRGSARIVIAANAVGMALAFFFAGAARRFAITSYPVAVFAAGIACVVAGGLLRRHCFRMLGDSFTYDVRVTATQQIVERGAYRYVRHPSYTAGVLMFGGTGLALGNWLSLAAAALCSLAGYAWRIAVEERALAATLPAYAGYMRRTKRLIPFVI